MFQAKAKLSVRFGSEKLNTEKVIEKTKICIPAMLKPCSASSFCLPNKNRVGVARDDGTNLEVVYTRAPGCFEKKILYLERLQEVWLTNLGVYSGSYVFEEIRLSFLVSRYVFKIVEEL